MAASDQVQTTTSEDVEVTAPSIICKLVLYANDMWVLEDADNTNTIGRPTARKVPGDLGSNTKPIKKLQNIGVVKTQGSTCWYCQLPNGDLWMLCI